MNKCSPVEMRKNLEIVKVFKEAGVDFVPIPVFGKMDKDHFQQILHSKMRSIAVEEEEDE